MTTLALVMICKLLLLCLFGLLSRLLDILDVVVEQRTDDGNHVSLDNPSPDCFGAAHTNVDNALKSEVPFPKVHHVLGATLLQDTH